MTQEQTQQIIDQVQLGITKASEALGVAAPQLWDILIKQQYVEAISNIATFLVTLIVAGIYVIVLKKVVNSDKSYDEDSWGREIKPYILVPLIVTGVLISMFLLFAFLDALSSDTIGKLINPAYYAIQDIANFIK